MGKITSLFLFNISVHNIIRNVLDNERPMTETKVRIRFLKT
jgi:hypothetical protein